MVPTPRGDRVCVYMGRDYFSSPSPVAHGLLGVVSLAWVVLALSRWLELGPAWAGVGIGLGNFGVGDCNI